MLILKSVSLALFIYFTLLELFRFLSKKEVLIFGLALILITATAFITLQWLV